MNSQELEIGKLLQEIEEHECHPLIVVPPLTDYSEDYLGLYVCKPEILLEPKAAASFIKLQERGFKHGYLDSLDRWFEEIAWLPGSCAPCYIVGATPLYRDSSLNFSAIEALGRECLNFGTLRALYENAIDDTLIEAIFWSFYDTGQPNWDLAHDWDWDQKPGKRLLPSREELRERAPQIGLLDSPPQNRLEELSKEILKLRLSMLGL